MRKLAFCVLAAALMAGACGTKRDSADWNRTRANLLLTVSRQHLAGGQLRDARSKAEEAVAADPENTQAQLHLARVAIAQGEWAVAVRASSEATRLDPGSADAHYTRAIALERSSQPDEAVKAYLRSASLGRSYVHAVAAASEIMCDTGHVDEASRLLDQWTQRYPDEVSLLEARGRLDVLQGRHAEAAAKFRELVLREPGNVSHRQMLARAQFSSGDYTGCVQSLQGINDRMGEKTPAWVLGMMGESQWQLERFSEAAMAFGAAARQSQDIRWKQRLAEACLVLDDDARAAAVAREIIAADSSAAEARIILATALFRQGELAEARSSLAESGLLARDDAAAWKLLWRICEAEKRDAEAQGARAKYESLLSPKQK